jgi:GT2 family glycosyltransferase
MPQPLVTIVVVPRERFSVSQRSLEAIYANTAPPFDLVYVDGGSPSRIRRYLADQSRARGFTLVRTPHHLVPNAARNLGVRHVRTRYVAFIDNDAVPAPGWLPALVECAESTGAWVVGPLYFIGEPEAQRIHMAAGDARIEDRPSGRRFIERHRFADKRPDEVRAQLVRQPCEHVEFHCMLVRTEVFERLGPLDEQLKSIAEHTDLCLLVRREGGTVYFEPASAVTYITSGGFTAADYAYFARRWSRAWNQTSLEHFRTKWDLPPGEAGLASIARWSEAHRHIPLRPMLRALERGLGWRCGGWLGRRLLAAEGQLNRWWEPIPGGASRSAGPVAERANV